MAREVEIQGKKYTLAEASAIRDEMLARPAWVNVQTCTVDGGVCTQNSPCKCCYSRRYEKKRGTMNKHVPFETPAGFIARLEAFEAKVGRTHEEEALTPAVSRRAARARGRNGYCVLVYRRQRSSPPAGRSMSPSQRRAERRQAAALADRIRPFRDPNYFGLCDACGTESRLYPSDSNFTAAICAGCCASCDDLEQSA